jgi:hypothetical protein
MHLTPGVRILDKGNNTGEHTIHDAEILHPTIQSGKKGIDHGDGNRDSHHQINVHPPTPSGIHNTGGKGPTINT